VWTSPAFIEITELLLGNTKFRFDYDPLKFPEADIQVGRIDNLFRESPGSAMADFLTVFISALCEYSHKADERKLVKISVNVSNVW